MEPSGRNRRQPVANGKASKTLKQADPQPVATHGNRFGAHGKEGVNGSSPLEGSAKRRTSALLRSGRLAGSAACGGYGADCGALASARGSAARGQCHLSRRVNAGDEVWMCDRDAP
jgi:hypothetical protein